MVGIFLSVMFKNLFGFILPKEREPMLLIVGLGNPGSEYERNRHNIGFVAIDKIASDYNFSAFRSKYLGLYSEGRIGTTKVGLLKPQTFMNNSGQSVVAASKFYKIPTDKIIVFFDELDLEPNKVRVKNGGGNAGHNGLKSIQAHLGTPNFKRVRIGIGHPGDKKKVSNYVLGNFAKSDQDWLNPLIDALSSHVDLLVRGDEELYMTKVADR